MWKPNGRYEHSIAFINNKIIIFGGSYFDSEDSEIFLGDTWEFDINTYTWTQFNTNGEKPSARKAHNMTAIDNDRIILFGGHDVSLVLNDTW